MVAAGHDPMTSSAASTRPSTAIVERAEEPLEADQGPKEIAQVGTISANGDRRSAR
jgi:hypothetical protein